MNVVQSLDGVTSPEGLETPGSTDIMPERVGPYCLERALGAGGMGVVYRAWDERLERLVAIKQIRLEAMGNPLQRQRFQREARAVAKLSHPAIVQVFDLLETPTGDWMVMEFVEGRPLNTVLSDGPMGADDLLPLAQEIAEGLAEAHDKGILHRDLKAPNVIVTPAGRAKILDFGLAKGWRDEAEEQLTADGHIMGTVYAMSPEQVMGEELDPRSDLFSLGSLLYEAATGTRPFRGRTPMATLRRVYEYHPPPILDTDPELPRALSDLVDQLLEKDRHLRPESAAEVAERLAQIQQLQGRGADPDAISTGSMATARYLPTSGETAVRTLAAVDLADRTALLKRLGDSRAADVLGHHDRFVRDLVREHGGLEVEKSTAFLLLFERPVRAVRFALAYHHDLPRLGAELGVSLAGKVGIHLGEVFLRRSSRSDVARGARGLEVEGLARPVVTTALDLARSRQTLLTHAAFDLARRASLGDDTAVDGLHWLAHGPYHFDLFDEPFEIYEVGLAGLAPLAAPSDAPEARRAVTAGEEHTLGWRPAAGQGVPRGEGWILRRRLGEGGFGEVWLATRDAGERRVFKFCFEATRLRALKREATLFRLLKEALGEREDIAQILSWNFDEAPYYLEAEYTEGGDLETWSGALGGLGTVPLETRLELVAQVADALAAAHSVGVLHKDVKPQNVLVTHGPSGEPRARLTDFGIGMVTDPSILADRGLTVVGASITDAASAGSPIYLAPEILEGKPPTVQADVFAVGVLLYQVAVGDLHRALASGWRRDVDDPILVNDISALVDGSPERRLTDLGELARRLRNRDDRRRRLEEETEARREAERLRLEVDAARRRRRLTGLVAILAVTVALVVSVFAYRENRASHEAAARRQQAEKLIAFMLGDLRTKLEPIGRLPILADVGDQAMEYFAGVAEDDLTAEERHRQAVAIRQIGEVRFGLENLDSAMAAFEESLAHAKTLSEEHPEQGDWLLDVGTNHFWVGYVHYFRGDLDAAEEQFRRYLDITRTLTERDPTHATWQLELASAGINLGRIQESRGDLDAALDTYESSRQAFASLVQREPQRNDWRGQYADVLNIIGRVQQVRGDLRAALGRYEEELELKEALAALEPENAGLQERLAASHVHVGDLLEMRGELGEAEAHFLAASDINRVLIVQDPNNKIWRRDRAIQHLRLGRVKLAQGEPRQALRQLRNSQAQLQELFEEDPAHSLWRSDLVSARIAVAQALFASNRTDAAFQEVKASLELVQTLPTAERNPTLRRLEAELYLLLGRGQRLLGFQDDAESSIEQAAERLEPLVTRSTDILVRLPWIEALLRSNRKEEARTLALGLWNQGYRQPLTTQVWREANLIPQ
ncbi:MAG: protein kinase [Acidobacteriota bacterium]